MEDVEAVTPFQTETLPSATLMTHTGMFVAVPTIGVEKLLLTAIVKNALIMENKHFKTIIQPYSTVHFGKIFLINFRLSIYFGMFR